MFGSTRISVLLLAQLIAHCCKICLAVYTGNINIVVIVIGDNPIYGFYAQVPMYDVTLDRLKKKYPIALSNATMHVVHEPGQFICPDAAAMMYVVAGKLHSLVQSLKGLTIIVSPGCSFEVIALGDFAREWNIPLFATIAGDQSLTDKRRFPTVIAYGPPDHPSLALAGKRLLEKFSWTTVTFLCDQMSLYPALAGFYQTACRNFRQMLDNDNAGNKYTLYTSYFNSNNTRLSVIELLRKAKSRCRIIFIFSRPSVMREILIEADRLNMTNGDYMFIAPHVTQCPTLGNNTWQYFNEDDERALRAFWSLIILNNPNPDWNRIHGLLSDVWNVTRTKYRYPLTIDQQLNDLSVAGYEVLSSFAEVVNESVTDNADQRGGGWFASLFFNRTFALDSRNLYINSKGMRTSDVMFFRISRTTGLFEETWVYYSTTRKFEIVSPTLAQQWEGPIGPPQNLPVCGYSDENCTTFGFRGYLSQVQLIAITLSAVLAIVLVFGNGFRMVHRKPSTLDIMWFLIDVNGTSNPTTLDVGGKRNIQSLYPLSRTWN